MYRIDQILLNVSRTLLPWDRKLTKQVYKCIDIVLENNTHIYTFYWIIGKIIIPVTGTYEHIRMHDIRYYCCR